MTYKNISTKSIDVEMEVFVVLLSREKLESPENYRKLNVRHYNFTLLPGHIKTSNCAFIAGNFKKENHPKTAF
ncbi:hypothetical protein IR010_18340 [Flavobacterium sp. MR2016-29]|uniref:hypothetical protein n=1 Tax=Flavobacterium sp. MR2016-29 TaxID=2783795 RepID=UPI00188B0935|nr:hypothetical protein [Flavobacterium sp. MR2016-29]MBF4494509.1 hypothetical protein [Flavobacterium sp. MR2016-29]